MNPLAVPFAITFTIATFLWWGLGLREERKNDGVALGCLWFVAPILLLIIIVNL